MDRYWREALFELEAGRRVYSVIVAEAKKGSPGTSAARMFVREDGSQFGTIGGGIMEKNILDRAGGILASGGELQPDLIELEHRGGSADRASGLICGGAQLPVAARERCVHRRIRVSI